MWKWALREMKDKTFLEELVRSSLSFSSSLSSPSGSRWPKPTKILDQKKNPGDPGVGCDKPEGISRAHIFSPPLPSSSLPPPPPQTLLEKVIFNKGDPRISEFRRREKVEVVWPLVTSCWKIIYILREFTNDWYGSAKWVHKWVREPAYLNMAVTKLRVWILGLFHCWCHPHPSSSTSSFYVSRFSKPLSFKPPSKPPSQTNPFNFEYQYQGDWGTLQPSQLCHPGETKKPRIQLSLWIKLLHQHFLRFNHILARPPPLLFDHNGLAF